MAEFKKGITQDKRQGVTRTITTTVTGLAETALDDINEWRTVVAANPEKLPFSLPPTLQKDIDSLNATIAFTGLKIPPLDVLETDLKKALGKLAQPTLLAANKKLDGLSDKAKKGIEQIKQIDWLL